MGSARTWLCRVGGRVPPEHGVGPSPVGHGWTGFGPLEVVSVSVSTDEALHDPRLRLPEDGGSAADGRRIDGGNAEQVLRFVGVWTVRTLVDRDASIAPE